MRAALPLAFLLLGSGMSAGSAFAQDAQPSGPEPRPQIVVTGEGEASARPDLAMLSLGVMREATTAGEALEANNAAMAAVIAAMKSAGVAEADLQTTNLSIEPQWQYPSNTGNGEQPKLTGYRVANSLGVRVRDVAKVGALLDTAVELGVNQGGQINFDAADPSKPLMEARKRAVQDARARAETLAEAAGVSLGSIKEISETALNQPPISMMAKSFDARASAPAVPVEAGENTYRVQVTVTFAISD